MALLSLGAGTPTGPETVPKRCCGPERSTALIWTPFRCHRPCWQERQPLRPDRKSRIFRIIRAVVDGERRLVLLASIRELAELDDSDAEVTESGQQTVQVGPVANGSEQHRATRRTPGHLELGEPGQDGVGHLAVDQKLHPQ